MKSKVMLVAVFVTAIMLVCNFSSAQSNETKKECSKECTKEAHKDCGTKVGNSSGSLDTAKICPVSGETIDGAEGAPVNFTYLGKEYTFCCAGCVKKFKAEPMSYIKDDLKCPVMGETADKNVSTIVDGVKYYFCCAGCIKKFEKDPAKFLNKNDKKD